MTFSPRLHHMAAGGLGAVITAAAFIAVLWIQHSRGARPFDDRAAIAATVEHDRAAMTSDSEGTIHGRAPVDVLPEMQQEIGMRLEVVRRESLTQTVRAVATVVPDESRLSHVHTRVAGWVEQLDVNTTGEVVTAGQPLARIFSQELFSSQIEYLAARRNAAAAGIASVVVASGRTRLGVLGMTDAEIDAVEAADQPRRLVTIFAPRSGVVVNRGVTVGTSVDAATTLLTIADLSRVWVLAEIPELSSGVVHVGTTATLDFPASGRTSFPARVDFVYPTLTERTRTLRVRLSAPNPRGVLRPGIYGTAAFEAPGQPVITVPREAVVDTGLQQHVFVATGGRFEPHPVTLGVRLADRVEIRSGIEEGERVVAAGVFLLDSESRLRATGATGGHQHGTPSAPPTDSRQERMSTPLSDPHAGHQPVPATDPHAGHRE